MTIDVKSAEERARKHAVTQGWALELPLSIKVRRSWFFGRVKSYEIYSNESKLGAKARFIIDADTGEILEAGYVPR